LKMFNIKNYDKLEELKREGYKRIDHELVLTRALRELITKAIIDKKTKDRHELCQYIANDLEIRHRGNCLDYQLNRMNIEHTGDILKAIDTYMFKHYKKQFKGLNIDDEEKAIS